MVTVSNIASEMQTESGYLVATYPLLTIAVTEGLIDRAIDYINIEAGTSIADLSGAAESKSLVAIADEVGVVKNLTQLLMSAFVDKGANVGLASLNVTTVVQDPQYIMMNRMIQKGIERLRGRSFERV